MNALRAINRKAQKIERAVTAVNGDVQALQARGGEGKIYYPMGCTLNFIQIAFLINNQLPYAGENLLHGL